MYIFNTFFEFYVTLDLFYSFTQTLVRFSFFFFKLNDIAQWYIKKFLLLSVRCFETCHTVYLGDRVTKTVSLLVTRSSRNRGESAPCNTLKSTSSLESLIRADRGRTFAKVAIHHRNGPSRNPLQPTSGHYARLSSRGYVDSSHEKKSRLAT